MKQDKAIGQNSARVGKEWISIHIINPETRFGLISVLYIAFALILLMHHVYVMLYLSTVLDGSEAFKIPWIIFATVSIVLGRMWRDKGFWILTALILLRFLRLIIPDYQIYISNQYVVILAIYVFFCCYSIGRVLGKRYIKLFIRLFCAVWTFAIVFISALGIIAAWHNLRFANLGGWAIAVDRERLRLIYFPVTSGIMTSVSIAVAMTGIYTERIKACRICYYISLPIMFIAGVLTVARVGYICAAAEISILPGIYLYDRLKQRAKGKGRSGGIRALGAALCLITIMTICITYIQIYMVDGFNFAKNNLSVVGTALAESSEVVSRKLTYNEGMDNLLNGRVTIWKQVFQVIRDNPSILLYGLSANNVMSGINAIRAGQNLYSVAHCHNVLLQILMEDGIPGLLLYIGFLVYFLKRAITVMLDSGSEMWIRILPLPVIGCLIGELVDNTTHVNGDGPQMTIMYLFIGLTIAITAAKKHDRFVQEG